MNEIPATLKDIEICSLHVGENNVLNTENLRDLL
jgi:hypothetical protein